MLYAPLMDRADIVDQIMNVFRSAADALPKLDWFAPIPRDSREIRIRCLFKLDEPNYGCGSSESHRVMPYLIEWFLFQGLLVTFKRFPFN